MKRLAFAVSILTFSAMSASAADLPARIYTKAPVAPVVVYNWTGCFIGANGGGLWARKSWTYADTLAPATLGLPATSHTASGGMGGGQIGCDYQAGRWVVGIQGDYDATNSKGSGIDSFFNRLSDESNVRGLGTVTVKGGYLVTDQFLLYVRGGVAFENDRYNIYQLPLSTLAATGTQNRTGGTVGIGGEYLITNSWSAFVEYDYYDMGTKTATLTSTVTNLPFTTQSIRERKDVVRAGLNWRFNLGGGAVVAKY